MSRLRRGFGAFDDPFDPGELRCAASLDGVGAAGYLGVQQFGVQEGLLAQRAIDGFEQRVVVRSFSRHERHDRNAEALLDLLRVDALALLLGHIHEIEHEHAWCVVCDAREIGQHIQAALKLGGVGHHERHVGRPRCHEIGGYLLFGRVRRKPVGTGQIDDLVRSAVAEEFALFALDRLSGPVPHVLTRPGEAVEQG